MSRNLLSMAWDLTMPPEAAPELLEQNSLADVILLYKRAGKNYITDYIKRAVQQLRSQKWHVTCLQLIVQLLKLIPHKPTNIKVVQKSMRQCALTLSASTLVQSRPASCKYSTLSAKGGLVAHVCTCIMLRCSQCRLDTVEVCLNLSARHSANTVPEQHVAAPCFACSIKRSSARSTYISWTLS